MAAATIRDQLRLRDTGCRSLGIVHAGEFTLLTIAGGTRAQLYSRCKEGSREPKEISRDYSDVSRIRSDKFSIGAEFVVGQEGRGQRLDRRRRLQTKPNDFIELLRKDIRSQKKQIIAENMDLSDAEAEKFWPVYDQYAAELSRIYDTKIALLNEYAENYTSMTGEQAENYIRKRAEVE